MSPAAVVVLANLLPLAGVAFWGWRVQDVVFLYWAENLVIGFFNALAMLAAGADEEGRPLADKGGRLVATVFFVAHYTAFCIGHGVVLAELLGPGGPDGEGDLPALLWGMARDPGMVGAAGVMAAGHAAAFFRDYLATGAYASACADRLMTAPYRRIVVTHLFIFAAALALQELGSPLAAMLAFVVLKTVLDVNALRRAGPGADGLA